MSTIPLGSPIGSFSGTAETNPGITGTGGTGDTTSSGAQTAPDSSSSGSGSSSGGYNSSSESAQKQAADTCGGSGGCGGGGCNTGATGDCCTYRGQLNLSMQKAFAPYTNSCSSCGGSGVQNNNNSGGNNSSGGAGSGSGATPTGEPVSILTLEYIFDAKTIGPPAAGHILFNAAASVTLKNYAPVYWEWLSPTEVDPIDGSRKKYSGTIYPASYPSATSYCTVNVVSMSNVDRNGVSAAPLLSTLTKDSIFGMDDITTIGAFVRFNYDSLLYVDSNTTNFSVTYASSSTPFVDGDVVTLVASTGIILSGAPGTVLTACPACAGTGLDGSAGGIPGLITAVFNGSAGWAGTTNYDIYGIVRS